MGKPTATAESTLRKALTAELRQRLKEDAGSIRQIARRYGVNPKTVVRWRQRASVGDGPAVPRRRALTPTEEARVIAVRKFMLLPLDDCLYLLRNTIPHITRSTLHRCLQRYGISSLQPSRRLTNLIAGPRANLLGVFQADVTAVRCIDGKCFVVTAADIYSKILYSEVHEECVSGTALEYINRMMRQIPYPVLALIVCDNRRTIEFFEKENSDLQAGSSHPKVPMMRWTAAKTLVDRSHARSLEHILGGGDTGGHGVTLADFREYIESAVSAFNKETRLKSLKGLTPFGYVRGVWQVNPSLFVRAPD